MSPEIPGALEQSSAACLSVDILNPPHDMAVEEELISSRKPFSYYLENIRFCSACH